MNKISVQLGGAITVLNGMGLGIGATLGTELSHQLTIEPNDGIDFTTTPETDTKLLEECIAAFSSHNNQSIDDIKVTTNLKYEGAKGMKTSSIVATGTIDLLSKYFEIDMTTHEIVNLGADASINAGVSLTGAIDDAYGTYQGGFWVTHNLKREVLWQNKTIPDLKVILLQPVEKNIKSDISFRLQYLDKYVLKQAISQANSGDWKSAIANNTRIYSQYFLNDWKIINELENQLTGTVGLNGSGPSLFVICSENSLTKNIEILENEYSNYKLFKTSLR